MHKTHELRLAKRMARLGTETAFEVLVKAKALEAQGRDIIHLEIGEPDFDTPEHIKRAAIEALEAGFTKYTPNAGIPELRQAISDKFAADNGLNYRAGQIVVSNGAKHACYNAILATCQPGDEVVGDRGLAGLGLGVHRDHHAHHVVAAEIVGHFVHRSGDELAEHRLERDPEAAETVVMLLGRGVAMDVDRAHLASLGGVGRDNAPGNLLAAVALDDGHVGLQGVGVAEDAVKERVLVHAADELRHVRAVLPDHGRLLARYARHRQKVALAPGAPRMMIETSARETPAARATSSSVGLLAPSRSTATSCEIAY